MAVLTPTPDVKPIRKRTRRDPQPRFKPDVSNQLDCIVGCADAALPADHLARGVRAILEKIDFKAVDSKYSSLGRRGFEPRHVLGVLVYGSLVNVHESTRLARSMKTDAAFRYVGGGYAMSEGMLRRFRRENHEFYTSAVKRTVELANQMGLIDTQALAVDSVRLRAEASTNAARTLTRSNARLEELAEVDVATLSEQQRVKHEAKVENHTLAVKTCKELGRTNVVMTSPSAALMKFPNGASAPGHRVTVTAAGAKSRFIIDVLIDSSPNDYGQLQGAAERALAALRAAGVPITGPIQLAADAGYFSIDDIAFAIASRSWVDILVREPPLRGRNSKGGEKLFTRDHFTFLPDNIVLCPAAKRMRGPFRDYDELRFVGDGCETCPLKPQCTLGKKRTIVIDPVFEANRALHRERMAEAGALDRYNQRIATIEPVFSMLEDTMGFRRVSSRKESSVRAEILLKVLAYNISRLLKGTRLCRVRISITFAGEF